MNDLCTAIGQAYDNYYKQLPRIHVKGRHIDLMSKHYAIEIIYCDDHYTTFLDAVYNDKIEKKTFTSQTHAAKEAPDFNRGRNWRTAWEK